ncbi:hypothetical protein QFC20_006474 [Naganishia adeliensis]|uniref:Uncharacterized protein n=1 Tax=Naganishia adeliensis TaxID=92952 RepID=A0ACC2VAW6_9TREE|nr:hypothetical protein QFC20_006474 [Naganishia adeliensis]
MDQAANTMLNAFTTAIGIINNRGPDVCLSWPEKIALNLADLRVQGDNEWDALEGALVDDADMRALDDSYYAALGISADDPFASEEQHDVVPVLGANKIFKHEFSDETTRLLYRVRGSTSRQSDRDLELNFIGLREALYRYWTQDTMHDKKRLEHYLCLQDDRIATRFNALLWPQLGR